ncbi:MULTISPECIES: hypothetical protein [Cytobacillus]|jgi:hypothetical protein|uniref:Uncharacterized protein n=1 Tax=Cytobacillus pseudoceanisediminis TaxID=3051614 RepID=A0ABZ2ZPP0_9BACI|nr:MULTISPECIES: hypothetical protein [Cytobacillus]EFV76019.1 hypothetical protein HMPREF1013_03657 [Bacillus sp. 2_A_57_CT2]MBY0156234.1 hypothetical protein [Cytobacillus firmus]MBU8728607.1 hypothetical protein [Cytobacillus oceanisediminis]MCM3244137.1 hypothetical protein [Cytobacillus oceanisediminis]MCM3392515.1 hypothetical protein [Cytobacillus oceanisediminis]
MENKPFHYDGSVQINYEKDDKASLSIPFELTDEMRKNIGTNPYSTEEQE